MAMEITNNYRSYVAQGMAGNSAAGSTKKKETEKTQETAENSKSKKTAERHCRTIGMRLGQTIRRIYPRLSTVVSAVYYHICF